MPTTNPTIARLGRLCDEWCESNGLYRRDIAERAEMAPPHLTRLLSGSHSPSIEAVARVLSALACKWADLDEPE